MLAFFSVIVVRAIVLVFSCLFVLAPSTESPKRRVVVPRIKIVAPAEEDSATAAEAEEKQPKKAVKPAEDKKKKKSVSISITDEGLKVGSDDETEVIFEFDSEELSRALEDLELDSEELSRALRGFRSLESIPESILALIGDEDSRRFYDVRGKDIVKFGESIYIGEYELVRGNVVSVFGDVEVEGKVMGDVVSIMGDIDLGPGAIVNGEVVSVLGGLDQHEDARVRGEIVMVGGSVPFDMIVPFRGSRLLFGGVARIIGFIVGVLLLGIVMAFLSDRMRRSSTLVFGSFFKSLGIGALVLIPGGLVVLLLAVIFSITIIGIPVAILIVFSFVAMCILGYFVSAVALGRVICSKFNFESDSPFVHGIIGMLALSILSIISSFMLFGPFIMPLRFLLRVLGIFIQLIALLIGVGAFVASKAGAATINTRPALPE
jgi:cytoskeletal protein CcmA (bactofilin family)